MKHIMETLHKRLGPLVEARWFERVMSIVIFANPIAIFPQVLVVLTAPSVDGVSLVMWSIFAAIQAAFVFHGIKTKSASVFLSMLVSVLESLTIIVTVLVRG
jgi:uncharacterized protein with PQ loop repeat